MQPLTIRKVPGFRVSVGPAATTLVLALVLVPAAIADEKRWPPEAEALYLERFNALFNPLPAARAQTGGLAYDPLEGVPGTAKHQPLPVAAADQRTISAEALQAAEDYAAARNSQALIVWRKGRVELAAYFNGADADTLIVGRSLAKPMTVMAVGRAMAEGHLASLDQPVADFITEWRQPRPAFPARERMQVRHLLDMRTGFLAQGSDPSPESILNRAYLHPYHAEVIIDEYPLTHVPGERYDYSNATSELVAPLLERATGQRYAEWIGSEVLAPIGARGGQVWVNRPGGTSHAGCCLLLPAESFLRLALLSLFDGSWEGRRLLPEGFVAETRKPLAQNPWAGMGLYLAEPWARQRGAANPDRPELNQTLHSEPFRAADLYLFDGNANQVAYIVPSQELVILRVGNAPPADLGWDNSYLPNTILQGIR